MFGRAAGRRAFVAEGSAVAPMPAVEGLWQGCLRSSGRMRGVTSGMEPLRAGDPVAVGEFRILGRLGTGGMGRVYLGRSATGRAVAVKLIRADLLDEGGGEFRRRFAREVAAARAVDARYTAAVVAADAHADMPWLATAYIPGMPLGDAVERYGALPERTLGRLAGGLAVALKGIHAAGLVHRDLKPSNVLLAVAGPRVIDFGIASVSGMTTLTATGQTVGTFGFMSPEQFERADVGPPSDVFSCGAVLAYAATGRLPFGSGPLPVLLANIALREPDLDGVPAGYADLLRECLAKQPDDRPSVTDLLGLLDGLPDAVGSVRTGRPDPDWLPIDIAHELLRTASAALDADGPAAADGAESVPDPGSDPAAPAPSREPAASVPAPVPEAVPEPAPIPEPEPDPDPEPAPVPPPPPADDPLPAVPPPPSADRVPELVNLAWQRTLVRPGGPTPTPRPPAGWQPWRFPIGRKAVALPTVADGVLYLSSADGHLYAIDAADGAPRWRAKVGGSAPSPPCVRDGLVVVHGAGLVAFGPADGGRLWQFATGLFSHGTPALADGVVYLSTKGTNNLVAVDAATGLAKRRWSTHGLLHGAPIVAGRRLFASTMTGLVVAVNVRSGQTKWTHDARPASQAAFLTEPALADDMLCVAGTDGRLIALDPATGVRRWVTSGLGPIRSRPVLAGTRAYVGSAGNALHAVDTATGRSVWRFATGGPIPTSPAVAAGVVYACGQDGTVYAVDAADGTERWRCRPGGVPYGPVVAGEVVYVCSTDRHLYAIDAGTGAVAGG
ncbi:PQQ-binding-like beta-propeller repeat protein [Embleya sp. NBC_00896]|uniref:outer membrane protein assembly factor BamB family protein n=1 Tax=Embleya sp. NBC_00896 TaxID=2975961 RepID=UPI00386452B8|nr:PQQ-binding-like beta-propeller repeat protein [Embleya sp. NBC_00896]